MNNKRFDEIMEQRLEKIKKVLASKGAEYSGSLTNSGKEKDRLHNFKRAAALRNRSDEDALGGMWSKHVVSIFDIIDDIEFNHIYPTVALLNEKVGDLINYAILFEALILENIEDCNVAISKPEPTKPKKK